MDFNAVNKSWREILFDEFKKDYWHDLSSFIKKEYSHKVIYPRLDNIFSAFKQTPFDELKVVILGQDPYHGAGQAHGLAFSVQNDIRIPPSLKNIYKEIADDVGGDIPQHGDLSHWAKQGVLLLNSTLTVEAGKPGSHQKRGWEVFTDQVIKKISDNKDHVVFILWGNYAKSKSNLIDSKRHLILKAPHPSPFSAYSGFFGCSHFSKTNLYLKKHKKGTIDWL